MTKNQKHVLRVFPTSFCESYYYKGMERYRIYYWKKSSSGANYYIQLGYGLSEKEAWYDAKEYLDRKLLEKLEQ